MTRATRGPNTSRWLSLVLRRGRSAAWVFAGAYAVAGGLWILFSDRVLISVIRDPHTVALVQTLKGWAFVAATAVLLFLVVRWGSERLARSRAERAVTSRRLETLMHHLPGMVYRCRNDPEWTMEWVSDGARALTGFEPADLRDNRRVAYADLIHPEDRESVWDAVQAAVAEDRPFQLTYRIRAADGHERWVWEEGAAERDAGGAVVALNGLILDITERKQLESQMQQAQKMEAIGQLTGGVAHDFNNLLTVMLSSTEFVLASLPEQFAQERGDLDTLRGAATRAAAMVKKLLAFSRREQLAFRDVALTELMQDLGKVLQRLLPAHIEIAVNTRHPVRTVRADPGAVEQILLNLATNARDAMPDGGTLTISLHEERLDAGYRATHPWVAPGDYACIEVQDTGVGMDEATREQVFEPFFTTKAPGVGTGLGMAMIYGLVKQHRGYVHVYSELGHGTVVKVFLPIGGGEEAVSASAPARVPVTLPTGSETILVVEDEEGIRQATKRALEAHGYRVLVARDGEEALEMLAAHPDTIHLILADLMMPKLGGRQLIDALRSQGKRPRVLFMSGYSKEDLPQSSPLEPDVPLLRKPWTLEELAVTVRAVLDAPRSRSA